MLALLDETNPPKLAQTITADDIMDADKADAKKQSDTSGTIVPVKFKSRAEAQEEANNQNLKNQAMMGAKQGVAGAFVHKFGSEITDPILCTPDGDVKGIDEFSIHELMQAVKDATDRPQASTVLESIIEATCFTFNFHQKVITNHQRGATQPSSKRISCTRNSTHASTDCAHCHGQHRTCREAPIWT